MRGALVLIGLVTTAGCATPRAAAESVTPVIAISPGVPGRLALMDRYRLHDEDRKHMMERPHVWVEESPDDTENDAGEDAAEGARAVGVPAATAEESAKPAQSR
ncbi:MAG: hypothetical protein U0270_03980 [Labilithrix sp.]